MQQHLSSCSARKIVLESTNSKSEPATKQSNKCKQSVLNNYIFSFTKEDQNELESLLVRAFCNIGIPFNVIENSDFQVFLQKACPSFQIPSCKKLSGNLLDKKYKDLKKVVQNVFDEISYFCMISDG